LRVFLDTGAFLALADEDGEYHAAAKSTHTDLLLSKAQFLTSNLVLSETLTIITLLDASFALLHNDSTLEEQWPH